MRGPRPGAEPRRPVRYRLYRCADCGTQFFGQSASAAAEPVNEASEYWEAHKFAFYNDPETRAALTARYDRMLDLARTNFGPIDSVLDIGCGTGNFLAYTQARGLQAIGVDLDPDPVAEARGRGLSAYPMSETGDPGIPEQLDAMSMWDVIEHIIDPLAVLKTLLPRVRPGGTLLFETPDGGFPMRRAVLALHRLTGGRRDKIYFTERGFRALMRRLDCEVVDVRRATSIRQKMTAVFTYEAERTGSRFIAMRRRTWPLAERVAHRLHVGNKLLIVVRVGPS